MTDLYDKYLRICQLAAEDDKVFSVFKRNPDYNVVLEHVSFKGGHEYLEVIRDKYPYLLNYIDRFSTNDKYGSPNTYWFGEFNRNISPTTLRYIKVLGDLLGIFGNINGMDIVEIGGGYGGQCKIISDIVDFKSYTLVDRDEVLDLSNKYLHKLSVDNIIFRSVNDDSIRHYDLCISNYAFSEIPRQYQDFYAKNIIVNSDWGYMTCNDLGVGLPAGKMSANDICGIKTNYKILQETPLTAINNFIYIWGDGLDNGE